MAITNNPTSSKMEFFTGSHCFTIIGYSRIDVSGIATYVKSKTFFIGGYEWCLIFYPKGNNTNDEDDQYISIYLELVNETDRVKALYRIELLGLNGKPSTVNLKFKEASIFEGSTSSWGTKKFVGKKDLDALGFLREDSLTLKCTVLVIKESQNIESSPSSPSSSSARLIPSRPTNTSSIMEFHNGLHLYTVSGYSSSHGLGTGMLIKSDAFKICGYNWCLRYYPDGDEKNDNDQNISCYLELVEATDHDVKVLFDLAFLDSNGKSSTTTPKCKTTCTFNNSSTVWGFKTFMNKNDLEASEFLKDDSFTVKCSIVIVKEPEALLGASST